MPFDVLKDAVQTTVASYTLGSGSLTVATGTASGFPVPSTSAPILITAVVLASYGTSPETFATYEATGVTGDTFTGLTLIDGVDTAFATGDIVEMRTCAKHVNDLATALATSIITLNTEASLTGSRKLTAGTGITFDDGGAGSTLTLNVTDGGSGTVTTVSVVSANGFAGTVATATSTPAITLSTGITGILKGAAGALVAATSGTDYLVANQAITLTGDTTGTGTTAITTATTKIGGKAVTLGGALTLSGAFGTTITVTGTTAVTLPTSGTLVNSAVTTLASLSLPAAQVTGLAASATTNTTNAANISSGTLPAARLPAPTASTLGGIESAAAVASQWINSISTLGVPALSQPGFSDLSGTATLGQLPAGVGTVTSVGISLPGYSFPASPVTSSGVLAGAYAPITAGMPTRTIYAAYGGFTAVANTTALTSLLAGSPTVWSGSTLAPVLAAGQQFKFTLNGFVSCTGTPNLTIQLLFNGTVIASSTAVGFSSSIASPGAQFAGEDLMAFVATAGGSGTMGSGGRLLPLVSLTGTSNALYFSSPTIGTLATVNTTSGSFDIKVQWGTASTLNSMILTYCAIEQLG